MEDLLKVFLGDKDKIYVIKLSSEDVSNFRYMIQKEQFQLMCGYLLGKIEIENQLNNK